MKQEQSAMARVQPPSDQNLVTQDVVQDKEIQSVTPLAVVSNLEQKNTDPPLPSIEEAEEQIKMFTAKLADEEDDENEKQNLDTFKDSVLAVAVSTVQPNALTACDRPHRMSREERADSVIETHKKSEKPSP